MAIERLDIDASRSAVRDKVNELIDVLNALNDGKTEA